MTDVPGMDTAGLRAWLEREHPELAGGGLTASVIAGGRSNLTYRVDGARLPLVVRRPPLGHVLSTAHDMRREHRVIAALGDGPVPVPRTVDVVDDTERREVTGTVFFVMEHVAGTVLSRPGQNTTFAPDGLHALGLELAEVLADLHGVDPAAVGLADFGRPDGYLDRQMSTWRRQYDASRNRPQPALDALAERLATTVPPAGARSGIVHGDFRLDNAIVAGPPHAPRVAAVLDWEMATLGHPLVDLGMLGLYWDIRTLTRHDDRSDDGALSAVVPGAGYPEFAELVDAYAARSGTAPPDLSWYRAFAAYKLAVILEGIHVRYRAGETVGEGFDRIGALVAPLAEDGLSHAPATRPTSTPRTTPRPTPRPAATTPTRRP
ncbi:phosphotransferase family protein [Krasilnikoviella flava]|uniref:Predicted kinase, aminoglycoside phosphotransferase (APT) family n=1 Tax=Krasilnikoviella flava TaxID=526729 RepID=A0A1T5M3H1_9MICO|nr:phosphotransferase family protein [Krasilnikoviella flava]SKC82675.1 Predicted kinase, aminoglycoside phosphotransferase (APT) family [Krasilnikoviella flava]